MRKVDGEVFIRLEKLAVAVDYRLMALNEEEP